MPSQIILGSRSPQRKELLARVIPSRQITVIPPSQVEEAGFSEITSWIGVRDRLREIARAKCEDVLEQLRGGRRKYAAIVTADTVIAAADRQGRPIVLGQPPEKEWRDTVSHWFTDFYFGQTHRAMTAIAVATPEGTIEDRVTTTRIGISREHQNRLEWYLDTEEPLGKAGGYAIQGLGSIFISRIDGSLTNVIGLPLEELLELFDKLNIG